MQRRIFSLIQLRTIKDIVVCKYDVNLCYVYTCCLETEVIPLGPDTQPFNQETITITANERVEMNCVITSGTKAHFSLATAVVPLSNYSHSYIWHLDMHLTHMQNA